MLDIYKKDGTQVASFSLGTAEKPIAIKSQQSLVDFIADCGRVLDEQAITDEDMWLVVPLFMRRRIMRFEQADRRVENDRRKRKPRNSIQWRYFGQRKRK